MPPIQATTARCTNLCLAVSLGLSVCISWALLTAAVVTVESIYYTSAARPVVYQMHYVFDLSVCVCVRMCMPGQMHSPTGLLSTSSRVYFSPAGIVS